MYYGEPRAVGYCPNCGSENIDECSDYMFCYDCSYEEGDLYEQYG